MLLHLIVPALVAAAMFWNVPYLPLIDYPQHVAQIAALHDLWAGKSVWQGMLEINYATPYLAGYLPAAMLAFLFGPLIASKLVLTLSFWAFLWVFSRLLADLKSDPDLMLLAVPGCFGLAFQFGFMTFLVALPIALAFVVLALRYARQQNPYRAFGLLVMGGVTFLAHALLGLFAGLVGGGMLLVASWSTLCSRRFMSALLSFWPYLLLLVMIAGNGLLLAASGSAGSGDVLWQSSSADRIISIFLYVLALSADPLALLVLPLLLVPWIVNGGRLDRQDKLRWVPLVVLVLFWMMTPDAALGVVWLYPRFAVLLLPFYALLFVPSAKRPAGYVRYTGLGLLLLCLALQSLVMVGRFRAFEEESRDYWQATATVPDGQRVLSLAYAPRSEALRGSLIYANQALWYQVEHQGWVEFNFASFFPQIVRYRPEAKPPNPDYMSIPPFRSEGRGYDWQEYGARRFDYIFVRHTEPLPARLFDNSECSVEAVASSGTWSVFKRGSCR